MRCNRAHSLILIGLVTLAGGCATLSKDECLRGDWYNIGFTDGTRGYTAARFEQHLDACKAYQVLPQRAEYLQGRQAGLEHYCTPHNGYTVGKAAADYSGVCPPEREEPFLRAYLQGYVVYAHEKVDSLRWRLSSDVDRLHDHLRTLDRLCREEPDVGRRKRLERDLDDFRARQRRLAWAVQEQVTSLAFVHWHVEEAAPPVEELRRLQAAVQRLNDAESHLKSSIDSLRSDITSTASAQERSKKEPRKK